MASAGVLLVNNFPLFWSQKQYLGGLVQWSQNNPKEAAGPKTVPISKPQQLQAAPPRRARALRRREFMTGPIMSLAQALSVEIPNG